MHNENFKTNYFDLGPDGKMPLSVLLRYFDGAAGKDADNLSCGIADLKSQAIVWILAKMQIKQLKTVGHDKNIDINTWHVGSDKLLSRRDFVLTDAQGEPVLQGISWWFLMDLNKRRIVRTLPEIIALNVAHPNHIMEEEAMPTPPQNQSPINTVTMIARLEDMDVNKHINNTHYMAWAIESVPQDIRESKTLDKLFINFKAEGFAKDEITVSAYKDEVAPTAFWHILTRTSDGKELVRIYTTWL